MINVYENGKMHVSKFIKELTMLLLKRALPSIFLTGGGQRSASP